MITRFITEVTTRFNPFSAASRSTRLFLSNLPADARSGGMKVSTNLLPRTSTESPSLLVKFSTSVPGVVSLVCLTQPPPPPRGHMDAG